MAEMIPDRLPSRASKGEELCFAILKRLPEDCVAYYEPVVGDRYPDFVVILPRHGVLIIEVKGWYPNQLISGDQETVVINDPRTGDRITSNHPSRQARRYMFDLMDRCRRHELSDLLLHGDGEHEGRFVFPFGNMVLLTNIRRHQLEGGWNEVFPPSRVVCRDELEKFEGLEGEELAQGLSEFFTVGWNFAGLDPKQLAALRAIIHPEAAIPPGPGDARRAEGEPRPDLRVLDLAQEAAARNLGSGHRLVFGVAGSGKTVLLLARVRFLAEALPPDRRVLVLCFNVCLAAYLEKAVGMVGPNVRVTHFHGLGSSLGVHFEAQIPDEEYGHMVLDRLEDGHRQAHTFHYLAIDEAQDFAPSWFRCALAMIDDPGDADVLIVGDGMQGLYRRKKIVWAHHGIQASGRTRYLKRTYRSSAEIMAVAGRFATVDDGGIDETSGVPAIRSVGGVRRSGYAPVFRRVSSQDQQVEEIADLVEYLVKAGRWDGQILPRPLQPQQIGIIYRQGNDPITRSRIGRLRGLLTEKGIESQWLSDPDDRQARRRVWEPGVKIQTVHSSKGLQYRAVILPWVEQLPLPANDEEPELEQRLVYVALTRAEDFLAVFSSGESSFVKRLLGTHQG